MPMLSIKSDGYSFYFIFLIGKILIKKIFLIGNQKFIKSVKALLNIQEVYKKNTKTGKKREERKNTHKTQKNKRKHPNITSPQNPEAITLEQGP
jgi:hypothetical protein